jgi:hypothetical protein
MLALWICARLVHDATSGLSPPWCGAGHPTPIVPSRGYERDCHAVETGPAMLSSESAPILRLVLDAWFLSLCTLLPRLRTDRRCRCLRHLQIRNDSTAPPAWSHVAGPRVSSNHRPGERASSGSSVVNMWKRFQMPAHSKKGPQRRSPLHALRWSGAEGATGGGPDAARLGRGRPSLAPNQP